MASLEMWQWLCYAQSFKDRLGRQKCQSDVVSLLLNLSPGNFHFLMKKLMGTFQSSLFSDEILYYAL